MFTAKCMGRSCRPPSPAFQQSAVSHPVTLNSKPFNKGRVYALSRASWRNRIVPKPMLIVC